LLVQPRRIPDPTANIKLVVYRPKGQTLK